MKFFLVNSKQHLLFLLFLTANLSIFFHICFRFIPSSLYFYFRRACPAVFTLPNWTEAPAFSSEIGLYFHPCCVLSEPLPSFLACEHHPIILLTSGRMAQYYGPISNSLQSYQCPPESLLGSAHMQLCPEHSPSSSSPIQIHMPLKTHLTSVSLIPFNNLSVHAHSASCTPMALIVLHKMLLFSIKTKWTSPRLSVERKWAGGNGHPAPWPDDPWNCLYSWIAVSVIKLAFSLKVLKIHH